jgi:cysteine desulfurase/selenocysteine lyase
MSIPALDPGSDVQTDLIARLAQEFYREGQSAPGAAVPPSPSVPSAAAGVPAAGSQPVPSSHPEFSAPTPDNELNGGFPGAHSQTSHPPVHPAIVGAGPETPGSTIAPSSRPAADRNLPIAGHEDASRQFETDRHSRNVAQSHHRDSGLPGLDGATEPQLYYLEGVREHHQPASAPRELPLFSFPVQSVSPAVGGFDIEGVRRDFPALHQRVHGHPLIWLDNAATTQKPRAVIEATRDFYSHDNSNIHRAAHTLAERSTKLFEAGREKVRQFLGASDKKEIVFVRGTTEAINLVAQSYGKQHVGAGDEILISEMEHHANIVPWQILAQQNGANLRVIPMNDQGELLLEELPRLLTPRTKIVSITHVSNSLGTLNPVEIVIQAAHARGIPVLVDGAQSTPHLPINVRALDADFYVFSGHKVFGPTGIGALYGKYHLLEAMNPWQGGGHMIKDVTFEKTVYNHAPEKFEAGTPDIAGVVGLGAAIDYMTGLGIPALAAYEHGLLEYAMEAMRGIPGIRPIGTARNKASVLGFVIPGISNERIADHLDHHGIAVRAGHHCALPSLRHFGVESTVRPSLAFYNTYAEVDTLIDALYKLVRL